MKLATRTNQLFLDLLVLSAAYFLSYFIRFEGDVPKQFITLLFFTWPYILILKFLVLHIVGVLRISWRYISLKDIVRISLAAAISCSILLASRTFFGQYIDTWQYAHYGVIPYGIILIDFLATILGLCGVRALRRLVAEQFEHHGRREVPIKRVLLVGAGQSGVTVAKELLSHPEMALKAIGFIDDDKAKIGTIINGIKVLGSTAEIATYAQKERADQILITISKIAGPQIRRLTKLCQETGLETKIIPSLHELVGGNLTVNSIRDVSIDDLLGREAVHLDLELIRPLLKDKCVLVTGAGGSIGSELCRQIANFAPKNILLLEQAENPLFAISNELNARNINITPIIADITDSARIAAVFATYKPEVVFHAAAHKHVPLMEINPGEAIKNNVLGTRVLAETASRAEVKAFLLISTDKAVNPSSVMGASKRIAELIIQALSATSKTKFVAVRFGNVLGSSGSVIPTFLAQIRRGGPVTVTHPDMRRYFMTIPEACQLVLEAISLGEGGEIFILDMGNPVKIVDLARDLITLSGFKPDEDIKIVFTGMRPGEKLFEELSVASEHADKTKHPKIFVGRIAAADSRFLAQKVAELEKAALENNNAILPALIKTIVPEYSGA